MSLLFAPPGFADNDGIDVETLLKEQATDRGPGRFLDSLVPGSAEMRREFREELGITIAGNYTLYSNWDPDTDASVVNGMAGLAAGWEVINRGAPNTGSFFFYLENRHDLTDRSGPEFEREEGSIWQVNAITSDPFTRVRQLYYRQDVFDDQLVLGAGKLSMRALWSRSRFTLNKAETFQSSPLALARSTPWPPDSVGFYGRWQPHDSLFNVSAGLFDAESDLDTIDLDIEGPYAFLGISLFSSPWTPGGGTAFPDHLLQVTVYRQPDTETREDGWGILAVYDMQLTDRVGLGLRYGAHDKDLGGLSQVGGAGLVFARPFERHRDAFGVGLSWARDANDDVDQIGGELFYRFHMISGFEVTPNVQTFERAAPTEDNDVGWVFGLRSRVTF